MKTQGFVALLAGALPPRISPEILMLPLGCPPCAGGQKNQTLNAEESKKSFAQFGAWGFTW